jgi:hypothetical protein
MNRTDPSGLYEIDVHYFLTLYLALKNGCFSNEQARQIAHGNQSTDTEDDKKPGYNRVGPNSVYHALHVGAAPGVGSSVLWKSALRPTPDLARFGNYLHYRQDTFSHDTYYDPVNGHSPLLLPWRWADHSTDKTATDIEKTLTMAKDTYEAIADFSRLACGCEGQPWSGEWDDVIRRFASVGTANPWLVDIEGDTGAGRVPSVGSFDALSLKIRVLGLM